jgi:lysozyme family protein
MQANFAKCLTEVLKHEGGFVDHPDDPGGATNWGVTERVARSHGYTGHMRDLTVTTAKSIYRKDYWDAVRAEDLPPVIRYAVFDAAVNSGVGQSTRWLQRALGVADDGRIGPLTIAAATMAEPDVLLRKMLSQRLKFMTSLSNWPSFSRGWARRIADLMEM